MPACAAATVVPGFNRPTMASQLPPRFSRVVGVERDRPPHLHRSPELTVVEAGRHDADDGDALAVEAHVPADDRGIAREAAPPIRVAQDDDVVTARLIVVARQRPADGGLHTEHREEVAGDGHPGDALGRVAGLRQREGRPRRRGEAGEHRVLILVVEEVGRRVRQRLRARWWCGRRARAVRTPGTAAPAAAWRSGSRTSTCSRRSPAPA